MAILFVFGVYTSVLYFGHLIIPNPDFVPIFRVGQELLSFKIPTSFKIAPVGGILQACLCPFLGGQHPQLTAGWLLNAILHPFNLILLWLVGREIVGKSALWLAIIAILNPWVIYLLREPINETPLFFFLLLTFYSIFKRSRWRYALASIAAVTRYEGAALILAAFVMDMIQSTSKRERIRAFLYSAMAAIPLVLWMLGTVLAWKPGTGGHYLDALFSEEYAKAFAQSVEQRTGLQKHMGLLWTVGFRPLSSSIASVKAMFGELTQAEDRSIQAFFNLSKVVAGGSFAFGVIYGCMKRNWNILALLIFFVPYFVLHAFYPYPLLRYHASVFWMALWISWFGLQSVWKLIDAGGRVPKALTLVLQGLVVVIAATWLAGLFPYLSKVRPLSTVSTSVPYVATALTAVIFVGRSWVYGARHLLRELSILSVVCLIIVSNQFSLVRVVGNGQKEKEFKDLAQWYVANTKPGEKMAVYMGGVVKIFAPERTDDITAFLAADSPADLVQALYEKDVTYVVWATREGLRSDHTRYNKLGLPRNINQLRHPKDAWPYQFITRLGSRRQYVHVFRLLRPGDGVKPGPADN
jgi:hypothetical protein